jgi:hypothetical protein
MIIFFVDSHAFGFYLEGKYRRTVLNKPGSERYTYIPFTRQGFSATVLFIPMGDVLGLQLSS